MNEIRLKKHGNMVRVHSIEASRIIIDDIRKYGKLLTGLSNYERAKLNATADALEKGIKDAK